MKMPKVTKSGDDAGFRNAREEWRRQGELALAALRDERERCVSGLAAAAAELRKQRWLSEPVDVDNSINDVVAAVTDFESIEEGIRTATVYYADPGNGPDDEVTS